MGTIQERNLEQSLPAVTRDALYAHLESALRRRQPPIADAVPTKAMRFTIVIPALNEEDAIEGTIRDVLDTRQTIIDATPVTAIHVVVVNDGSTDRTQEIAAGFSEIKVIQFLENRGYGAAIKAGFLADDSELVGFMDADGTLQAGSWIPLLNTLFQTGADVVLGARLNENSQMPLIRRLGNWGFARLLGYIAGQPLTDCASGMRVIQRRSLKYLMPLPDGLHFTPAMSCNALQDIRIKIAEVAVPYAERLGRSKLSVVKDGLRFLSIILLSGCFYNPIKLALSACALMWAGSAGLWALGWSGADLSLAVAIVTAATCGASLVCHQAVKALIVARPDRESRAEQLLQRCTRPEVFGGLGLVLVAAALLVCLLSCWKVAADHRQWTTAAMILFGSSIGCLLLFVSLRMMQRIREKFEALLHDPFSRES